uniref:Uncharacterized protein n=1 Tax=Molossus molossus TaxID=27622 RepID=A0A7J8GRP3_MOLMO|nr:hypothetical protein HJG59_011356 [Molossus molossus]
MKARAPGTPSSSLPGPAPVDALGHGAGHRRRHCDYAGAASRGTRGAPPFSPQCSSPAPETPGISLFGVVQKLTDNADITGTQAPMIMCCNYTENKLILREEKQFSKITCLLWSLNPTCPHHGLESPASSVHGPDVRHIENSLCEINTANGPLNMCCCH